MINYKVNGITRQELLELNFKYDKRHSDVENELYTMRFPVYREKDSKRVTIEANIIVNPKHGGICIDVYDDNLNQYTAWYIRKYGKNKVVDIIDNNIDKKLNTLFGSKLICHK